MADDLQAKRAELESAMASGNMKAVIELAQAVKKMESEADRTKAEANKELIVELAVTVRGELAKVAKKFQDQITELVGVDKARVKFEWDFQDESTIAISKSIGGGARKGGGGTPQRYEKSTTDLLSQYGAMAYKKNGEDTEQTLQQAWDASTDKNHRFGVRGQLVKIDLASQ